jgi:hypothetical protein
MDEPQNDDRTPWDRLNLETCPQCGSPKVVPAVPGWEDERYCLGCQQIVGPSSRAVVD